jgi:hypothetical protein
MNELFLFFSLFAIGSLVLVITLIVIVLMLLKEISKLENDLETNLPPF